MQLYKNEQQFRDAIIAASNYYHLSPSIVEKDYFVTVVLNRLKDHIPGILFKGGTSLSKCFKLIERFSEDIDLTLDETHFSQGNKRKANKAVITVCDELCFNIQNREQVELHTHGNYNCYNIEYPVMFNDYGIKPYIKLEMTFIQKAYPITLRQITPIIGEYLIEMGQAKMLPAFQLEAFEMNVQSLERTFVDKVFALCDYYIRNEVVSQSRHIYDLKKLMTVIQWRDLSELVYEVRSERKLNKTCVSAHPGVSVPKILHEIVENDYFKVDYESVTSVLLNEKVSYNDAIFAIKQIADDSLFEE